MPKGRSKRGRRCNVHARANVQDRRRCRKRHAGGRTLVPQGRRGRAMLAAAALSSLSNGVAASASTCAGRKVWETCCVRARASQIDNLGVALRAREYRAPATGGADRRISAPGQELTWQVMLGNVCFQEQSGLQIAATSISTSDPIRNSAPVCAPAWKPPSDIEMRPHRLRTPRRQYSPVRRGEEKANRPGRWRWRGQ